MKEIVQIGDEVLREVAAEVPVEEIPGKKIQNIVQEMVEALEAEPDGAALAAPQIGVSLRIFVLARRVFGAQSGREEASKDTHLVFINPTIIKRSRRKEYMDEGCLSVRGHYGTKKRHTNVTITAYDEHGHKFTRGAGGLLAQAFQHECDHLDGILFVDGAEKVWDVEVPDRA